MESWWERLDPLQCTLDVDASQKQELGIYWDDAHIIMRIKYSSKVASIAITIQAIFFFKKF